jgi:hypothetical protein
VRVHSSKLLLLTSGSSVHFRIERDTAGGELTSVRPELQVKDELRGTSGLPSDLGYPTRAARQDSGSS